MQHVREILRQKLALGRTHREVAKSVGVSPSTVASVFADARSRGLDAAAVEALTDAELDAQLYAKPPPACVRAEPDCAALHLELRRPGVTLALLHVEFLAAHPEGLRYSAFCDRYRAWSKRSSPVMRQVHVAGDKLFVDYAGMKPYIVDATTGEVIEVELFVAVLGASNYTFAEATRTQSVPDFVGSVARTLTFLGGAPRAIVPDQLKSAVIKACRYDPGIQRTTAELARYYDTTILPARPRSPRDKAKVEVGVQIAERWLLARIRNETFTSLGALNARLAELTADLNGRTMRTYKASRRELFEKLDMPALTPLPAEPFEASSWKKVALNIDYHVAFEDHFYSAPHALRHEDIELWLRATSSAVEIFHGRERVTAHLRSFVRGGYTTKTEHMPRSHRAHAEWTPTRILGWADQVGPNVRALCEVILRERHWADRGRNTTWAPSCVREMLTRERYRGVFTWGKTAKVYRAGTKTRIPGDPAKMTRIELPDLRIIDDALWKKVAARMAADVKLSSRQGGAAGPPARFLLSGLARCAICGGRIEAVNGKVGSQVVRVYICGQREDKGAKVCTNAHRRPVAGVDAAVIEWIRINVLREELVIETLREVRRRLAERTSAGAGDRTRLEERAKEISAQPGKLGAALLASDEKPATVLAMISEREKELGQIRGRLAAVAAAPSAVSLETRRMERDARKRLGDLRGLFERNPADARRALELLLDGPLTMHPIGVRGSKRYEVKGVVNTGPMFTTDSVPTRTNLEPPSSSWRGRRRGSASPATTAWRPPDLGAATSSIRYIR